VVLLLPYKNSSLETPREIPLYTAHTPDITHAVGDVTVHHRSGSQSYGCYI